MSPRPTPPTPSFADLPPEVLVAVCDYLEGDGHGMYNPAFLTECGVPDQWVASVTETYKSDGTYKGSIFAPGSPGLPGSPYVPEMTAVYSLDVYRRIGRDLGLPGSGYGGRGFEARDWDRRIRQKLAEKIELLMPGETLFKVLTEAQEAEFKQWAMDNDPPNMASWEVYHPVCRNVWMGRGIFPPKKETGQ